MVEKLISAIMTAMVAAAQLGAGASSYVQNDIGVSINESASQVIEVVATGNTAEVTMYEKHDDGLYYDIYTCDATIGKNGIGKTKEGDKKTPAGDYGFLFAFGNKANPGTSMSYTQVDDTYYWVDDSNSVYYNKFVTTTQVQPDWTSAEHISTVGSSYNYAIALDYNATCAKGKGSAIFLHCRPTSGAGCIAVDESDLVWILQHISTDCRIIIR